MNTSNFIFDASGDNFTKLVLDNSRKGPVMVNYWSPKAGPCLKLWPTLEQLVEQYGGRFLLVNINVEREPELAREYGINSIPTVKLFINGKAVEQVHGADSINTYRRMVDRHLKTVTDPILLHALKLYQQGETAEALGIMKNAMQSDASTQLKTTYAKLLFREGQYENTLDILAKLPPEDRMQEDTQALIVHSRFMLAGQEGMDQQTLENRIDQNADDLESRLQLCAKHLEVDQYEGAMQQLLQIMKRNREFQDDIGRRGLVVLFNLLGKDHELTVKYRKKMQALLNYN